ncbi:MAG TPA: SRPBCC family protein [Ktedonobacterales bacterium]|jgi:hypothetical protein
MAQTSFEQSITVAAPVERVRAALATLTAHDRLHPLIVSVQALPGGAADGSALSRYRIVDRVRMGPLTLRVTYRAETAVDAAGAVVSDAYQSPGVHLHVVARLTALPPTAGVPQTRVDETVTVEAPRLLLGYVGAQARQSHRALYANLKAWLESTPPSDA